MLPTSLLCRTFLICLVDSCDLLVVPCGHDFDEDTLICASPLEESGKAECCGCHGRGHGSIAPPVPGKGGAALTPGLPHAKSPCPANGPKGW